MAVTILTKKKLGFRNPDPTGEKDRIYTPEVGILESAPDWVTKDPMFQWALASGSISAVADKPKKAEAAAAPKKKEQAEK